MRISLLRACICSQGHDFFRENGLNLRQSLGYNILVIGVLSLYMPLFFVVYSTYTIFLNKEFVRLRL